MENLKRLPITEFCSSGEKSFHYGYADMKHIDGDELMELSVRVAGKLESMSDEEYAGLVLEAAE